MMLKWVVSLVCFWFGSWENKMGVVYFLWVMLIFLNVLRICIFDLVSIMCVFVVFLIVNFIFLFLFVIWLIVCLSVLGLSVCFIFLILNDWM